MSSNLVVVVDDPVVSLDLVQTLQHCFPDAVVHAFRSFEDAKSALSGVGRAQLAIAHLSLAQLAERDLNDVAAQLGERLILLSDTNDLTRNSHPDLVVLSRPFTENMIAKAVFSFGVAQR